MKTFWEKDSYLRGIDHWYEENGRVFVVYCDGMEVDQGIQSMRLNWYISHHNIIEKDIPEKYAKIPRNNSPGDTK